MAEIPPHPAEPGRLDRRTLVSAAAWAVPVIAMAAAAPSAAASDHTDPPGWGGGGSTDTTVTFMTGTWVRIDSVNFQLGSGPYAQFYVHHQTTAPPQTVYYGYMLKQTTSQAVQNSRTLSANMPARQYMQVVVNEFITDPPSSMVIVAGVSYELQAWARVTDTSGQTELVLSVPIARTFQNNYNV